MTISGHADVSSTSDRLLSKKICPPFGLAKEEAASFQLLLRLDKIVIASVKRRGKLFYVKTLIGPSPIAFAMRERTSPSFKYSTNLWSGPHRWYKCLDSHED
jgi:hypothetical protein